MNKNQKNLYQIRRSRDKIFFVVHGTKGTKGTKVSKYFN